MRKTLNGPNGAKIHLNSALLFPDDPGADTPAMVEYRKGFSTFTCAQYEGYVSGRDGEMELPNSIKEWLNSLAVDDEVDRMYASGHNGSW